MQPARQGRDNDCSRGRCSHVDTGEGERGAEYLKVQEGSTSLYSAYEVSYGSK